MLRAVRFATTLGFTIDPRTAEAIRESAPLAKTLSGERIQQEMVKILSAPKPSVAFRMLSDLGLLAAFFNELEIAKTLPQDKAGPRRTCSSTVVRGRTPRTPRSPSLVPSGPASPRLSPTAHFIKRVLGESKPRHPRRWRLTRKRHAGDAPHPTPHFLSARTDRLGFPSLWSQCGLE